MSILRVMAAVLWLFVSSAAKAQMPTGELIEGGGDPLDANANIRKLRVPVLDLYADATPLDLSSAEARKPLVGTHYRQVRITGANHSFRGHEAELATEAVRWLKEREAR